MSAAEYRDETGQPLRPWKETAVVGKPLPRVDGYERVSGAAVFPSDTSLPGMLYGAILRCPYAHARVKGIDTREAEKMPGVRAVITGKTPGAGVDWSYTTPVGLFGELIRTAFVFLLIAFSIFMTFNEKSSFVSTNRIWPRTVPGSTASR